MSLSFDDLIGRDIAPPRAARYPVSEAMIVQWCDALDDDPSRWRDAAGPLAPSTMLHIFTMPGAEMLRPMPSAEVIGRLDAAGCTAPLATNYEQEYLLPIRPGDVIAERVVLEAVSEEKTTPMGVGHFVSMRFEFTNQRGETVGRQLMRVFKYRPAAVTSAMAMDAPVRPWRAEEYPAPVRVPVRDSGTPVAAGGTLPELRIELTPSRIVLGAIASNDAIAVHHDKDTAQAGGLPNVFMNILTQCGWVGRYVHEWAGPGAQLQRIALRLGVPNVAHDTMSLSATVAAVDSGMVTVDVRSRNRIGEPLRASVAIRIPGG